MAKWLRVRGEAGRSEWLAVLMPYRRGSPAPTVEKLSPTSLRVRLGSETEIVHLGSAGEAQAAVVRDGRRTILLDAGEVRPWAEVPFPGVPHRTERVKQED